MEITKMQHILDNQGIRDLSKGYSNLQIYPEGVHQRSHSVRKPRALVLNKLCRTQCAQWVDTSWLILFKKLNNVVKTPMHMIITPQMRIKNATYKDLVLQTQKRMMLTILAAAWPHSTSSKGVALVAMVALGQTPPQGLTAVPK